MSCYAVFLDSAQLRVYPYSVTEPGDRPRAAGLAFDFCDRMRAAGYPCRVEYFSAACSQTGCIVDRCAA